MLPSWPSSATIRPENPTTTTATWPSVSWGELMLCPWLWNVSNSLMSLRYSCEHTTRHPSWEWLPHRQVDIQTRTLNLWSADTTLSNFLIVSVEATLIGASGSSTVFLYETKLRKLPFTTEFDGVPIVIIKFFLDWLIRIMPQLCTLDEDTHSLFSTSSKSQTVFYFSWLTNAC